VDPGRLPRLPGGHPDSGGDQGADRGPRAPGLRGGDPGTRLRTLVLRRPGRATRVRDHGPGLRLQRGGRDRRGARRSPRIDPAGRERGHRRGLRLRRGAGDRDEAHRGPRRPRPSREDGVRARGTDRVRRDRRGGPLGRADRERGGAVCREARGLGRGRRALPSQHDHRRRRRWRPAPPGRRGPRRGARRAGPHPQGAAAVSEGGGLRVPGVPATGGSPARRGDRLDPGSTRILAGGSGTGFGS